MQVIKKGSTGSDVKCLQVLLRSMGFTGKDNLPLSIDSSCGDNLIYAINAYQKMCISYGVDVGTNNKPDSSCGPKMWISLLGGDV